MRHEEKLSAGTHAVGVVLSIIGLIALLGLARTSASWIPLVSCAIYGASLIALYLSSTLLHAVPPSRLQKLLHRCDHMAIFFLIAGTYTPFSLMMLRGEWGWGLCIGVWVLAMVGMLFKAVWGVGSAKPSVAFYLALGWIGLLVMIPVAHAMPVGGLVLILAGGLAYSGGVPFFLWETLPFNHAIWHLFVLCGSACHFAAIYCYALAGLSA